MSNIWNKNIAKLLEESKKWSIVSTYNMSESDKTIYESRKKAVDMYLNGESLKIIEKMSGIKYTHVKEFVDRCASLDSSGQPVGYIGLIKGYQLKSRKGSFIQLLEDHPDIRDQLLLDYYNNKKSKWDKLPSFKTIHKSFIKNLIKNGFKETDYPFNTQSRGYRSMIRFLHNIGDKNPYNSLNRYGKDAKQLFRNTYSLQPNQTSPKRPFAKVELDGHKIDALFTVAVENENGDIFHVLAKRIWIIAVIDVATRVVLGYTISVSQNYNRFDVLECIQNAIIPHKKVEFSQFNPQKSFEGYHSIAIPDTKWALFDEICLDNALSHLSRDVLDNLEKIGVSLNYGPVATPHRRPYIERFFKTLEEKGFHRMPSTTGSNSNDLRRIGAEKDSVRYQISLKDISEIAEIVISEYNMQPHESLGGFSPLSIMKDRMDRGLIPSSYVPDKSRKDFSLMKCYQIRKVQGNKKKGIRPYVNFSGYKYAGSVLSSSYTPVGKNIVIEFDPLDIRELEAYLENGAHIGRLVIKGKQIGTAISLKTNKLLRDFMNVNNMNDRHVEDAIGEFANNLKEKALFSKKAATYLASVRNDAEKRSPKSNILPQNKRKCGTTDKIISENEKKLLSDEELMEKWSDPSKKTW
jgi:transposase InsO family protein